MKKLTNERHIEAVRFFVWFVHIITTTTREKKCYYNNSPAFILSLKIRNGSIFAHTIFPSSEFNCNFKSKTERQFSIAHSFFQRLRLTSLPWKCEKHSIENGEMAIFFFLSIQFMDCQFVSVYHYGHKLLWLSVKKDSGIGCFGYNAADAPQYEQH